MGPRAFAAILAVALGVLGAACASSRPAAGQVERPIAEHVEPFSSLFDDTFNGAVLGLRDRRDADEIASDISEQSTEADAIVRAKIRSVFEYTMDGKRGYRLSVDVEKPAIAGLFGDSKLELAVDHANLNAPLLETPEHLLGSTMLLFLRLYAAPTGKVVHFRAEPDSQSVLELIEAARLNFD